jgi:surface carbohydrate biosynthesis protein
MLNFKFIFRLFLRIKKFGFGNNSALKSIIDVASPKVLITFIDNSPIMGMLQATYPDKLCISIQNGIRYESHYIGNTLPYYFGFGDFQKYAICKYKIKNKKYETLGSLKLGLYSESKTLPNSNKDKIVYISQYRANAMKWRTEIEKEVFPNIARWCKDNGKNLVVAMINEYDSINFDRELQYFSSKFGDYNIEYKPNNRKSMGSYETCFLGNVCITIDSTLGFEVFGCGRKVLFCSIKGRVPSVAESLFEKIPYISLLSESGYENLSSKMTTLCNMPNKKYKSITQESRPYYMKYNKPYPHVIISNYIEDYIGA